MCIKPQSPKKLLVRVLHESGDLIILIHSVRHWIALVFGLNLDTVSEFFCKIDEFQAYLASCIAFWLINVISLDRLATVVYSNNQKFQIFKKKWFKVSILLIVIVCSLSLNILQPITNQIVFIADLGIKICIMPSDVSLILSYILLANTIVSIILINAALNIKIIVYVMQTRKKVTANMNSFVRSTTTVVKDRRFVINAIAINSCCFICMSMFMICIFVITYVPMSLDLLQLLFTLAVTISNIDNALTFFINLIVNPTFYAEFLCMIGLRKQQVVTIKTNLKNNVNSNNISKTTWNKYLSF